MCTITPAAGYGLASLTVDGNSVLAAVSNNTYTLANVTAPHLLQATFSQSVYNIAATVPAGNGTLSCQNPVVSGTSSVCTITPAVGFVLAALTLDGSDDLASVNGNAYVIPNVTSSHAVVAAFAPAVYAITASVPGGDGTVACTSPVTYGGSSSCAITPAAGYVLTSLTLDGNSVFAGVIANTYTIPNVTAPHLVQGNFSRAPYAITAAVPGGNGIITCASPILYGQTAVCQISPAFGYWLQTLTLDGNNVLGQVNGNSLAIPNVTADHVVVGSFAVSTYSITVSVPGGNGTITCSSTGAPGGARPWRRAVPWRAPAAHPPPRPRPSPRPRRQRRPGEPHRLRHHRPAGRRAARQARRRQRGRVSVQAGRGEPASPPGQAGQARQAAAPPAAKKALGTAPRQGRAPAEPGRVHEGEEAG